MSRAFLHVEVDAPPRGAGPEPFARRSARDLVLKGILSDLTDRIESVGLCSFTADLPRVPGMERVAREISDRIERTLHVAPAMGLAPNSSLARMASRAVRPAGLLVIEDAAGDTRVTELPVDAIHGVGPVSTRLLDAVGVRTVGDLLALPERRLIEVLGPVGGARVHRAVHGRDPGVPRRTRSSERTFPAPVTESALLVREVSRQLAGLLRDLAADGAAPRTVSVRLRTAAGESTSRTRTFVDPCADAERLTATARKLLFDRTGVGTVAIRAVGVSLSGMGPSAPQLALPFH